MCPRCIFCPKVLKTVFTKHGVHEELIKSIRVDLEQAEESTRQEGLEQEVMLAVVLSFPVRTSVLSRTRTQKLDLGVKFSVGALSSKKPQSRHLPDGGAHSLRLPDYLRFSAF